MKNRSDESVVDDRQNTSRQESRLIRWIFLDGHRSVLSLGLLAGIFGLAVLLARVDLITVLDGGPITTLVGALIGGMLPFITVVLAIIQLTLSEEFGTTGTFRERLDETETFRQNIEDHTNVDMSPAEPDDFLRLLMDTIGDQVTIFSERSYNSIDEQLAEDVDECVQFLGREVEQTSTELEAATFGTFEVVSIILDFDDAQHLHDMRRIETEYSALLPDQEIETLESIKTLLDDVHIARLYFKTVYMQQELVNLSRMLLYVGFPALTAGGFLILTYSNLLSLSLGRPVYVFLVSAMVTIVFAPFVVLLAYIIRIATVAQWTAADFGPFLLQR